MGALLPGTLPSTSLAARYAGLTVVAVGAHPDDVELAVGGTLAVLSRAGARIVMAVASVPSDVERRTEEAGRAAGILGAELTMFPAGRNRRIEDMPNHELVAFVDGLVRTYRPAAVFGHGATEFHRDHVAVHGACRAAQRLGFFDLYSFQPTMCRPIPVPFQPRLYVDISQTIEIKMQAINAHASQFGARSLATAELYRDIARVNGRFAGVPYAEGLEVLRMVG
jgi:N-acetylglucosamine malate deacetylase 1